MSYRYGPQLVSGAYHYGGGGLGVLGSAVPSTGTHGPGYLYNDLSLPADADKEVMGRIITPPAVGNFFAYEDSSYILTDAPDGIATFTYQLSVGGVDSTVDIGYGPGVGLVTITIGDAGSVISGSANLGDITASGNLAQAGASDVSGSATLGDVSASGNLAGAIPAVIPGALVGLPRTSAMTRPARLQGSTRRQR